MDKYLAQKDALHAGRTPRVQQGGLEVRDLVNRFLTAKRHLLQTGEITQRTFADYHDSCERVVSSFGKSRLVDDLAADDFGKLRAELARTRGPVVLGNEIQRVRSIFKFAYDEALIDKPIRFGQSFKKPSRKVLRKARNERGSQMFEADELRRMIRGARNPQLKAMILLGVNCGFGNHDCATLPFSAIDLESRWIDYPRPKTGVYRRCPLWPETVDALREAIAKRPPHKDAADAELVFITKYGRPWAKVKNNAVSGEIGKLLDELDLKQLGRNFYALRHVFQTVGGESRDQVAVNAIMGHVDDSMAAQYRERISDERLRAVVDLIHAWLFAPEHDQGEGENAAQADSADS